MLIGDYNSMLYLILLPRLPVRYWAIFYDPQLYTVLVGLADLKAEIAMLSE